MNKNTGSTSEFYKLIDKTIETKCYLDRKRADFKETIALQRDTDQEFLYRAIFEPEAECIKFSAEFVNITDPISMDITKYNGSQFIHKAEIKIKKEYPVGKPIILLLEFNRKITVEKIEGFFDMHRSLVGTFASTGSFCENLKQTISMVENNSKLSTSIINAISPAKYEIYDNGKKVDFVRQKLPPGKFTPMTIVVEHGDMKKEQNKFQLKWTMLGFVLSLALYIIDKIVPISSIFK